MENKHIVALALFTGAGFASIVFNLLSQRVRDISLFFIVFTAVMAGRVDVNFLTEEWYRGTSRGIEVMPLDLAAMGLLIGSLLLPRYPALRWHWPASFGFLLLYVGYCAISVLTSTPQLFGVWELSKILRGVLIFLAAAAFIRTERELRILVLALSCAILFETAYGLQQLAFKNVGRVPGTLFHGNSLSMYLCTISPVVLAAALSNWPMKLRVFCALSCCSAAFLEMCTLSRAGIPLFVMAMFGTAFFCTTWRITKRKVLIGFGLLIGTGLLALIGAKPLMERFSAGSLSEELFEADAVETRGTYWRLGFAIAKEQPYGVGLNNWSYAVSKYYGAKLGYLYTDYDSVSHAELKSDPNKAKNDEINHAPPGHSLAVITWGELGYPGLLIFSLLWMRWFQVGSRFLRNRLNPDPMHRIGIGIFFGTVGIFLHNVTEWTYRQTSIMFTFHILMGALASLAYMKKRGPALEEEPEEDLEFEAEAPPLPLAARVRR